MPKDSSFRSHAAGRAYVSYSSTSGRMEADRRRPSSPPGAGGGAPSRNAADSGDRIGRLCVERGVRMTNPRRLIARVLSEAQDHPDVEEVYRRALLLDNNVSIATVYRTVRLFEEYGILERRDFGGGRARYEPVEHGHHHHLVDVDTGQVVEFQSAEYERLMREIAAGLGFVLVDHRLELFVRRTEPDPATDVNGATTMPLRKRDPDPVTKAGRKNKKV